MLIDADDRVFLADFGMANYDRSSWLDAVSNSTNPGGTTAYMAPELFCLEGRPNGPLMKKEADIYALGTLIYEVWSTTVVLKAKSLKP